MINTATSTMTNKRSAAILQKLEEHYGEPTADLNFSGLYQLCIAVVLSAQTTDKQVNAVTPHLFAQYPDFKALSLADINAIEEIVKSTGFYRNKARNIVHLAQTITREYGGNVPDTRAALTALPGIGRKSANVILSMGFGIPAFAVDTHVLRIANRIGYIDSDSPLAVEHAVTSTINDTKWITAHLLFIRHGRSICTARSPRCMECPVSSLCEYSDKTV